VLKLSLLEVGELTQLQKVLKLEYSLKGNLLMETNPKPSINLNVDEQDARLYELLNQLDQISNKIDSQIVDNRQEWEYKVANNRSNSGN